MSVRAGIVVTGTEVLTGRVLDRNGPWLSEQLLELGADPIATAVVGDRPDEILRALRFLAAEGCELICTTGGLGPTADDLTAAVVGEFQGREMVLDEALEGRIAEILRPLMARWPDLDPEAVRIARARLAAEDPTVPLADIERQVVVADGLTTWTGRTFAAVIGNPPFLSQMAAATSRGESSVGMCLPGTSTRSLFGISST